jgi:hypothetical protein
LAAPQAGVTRAPRALSLVPPLVLLCAIAAHAVNVPRWDDWGLVPFVLALRDGSLGFADFWAQHNEHRIAAVKLILVPLMLATDFDVTAMMYAGFALQLGAFAFLSSLLGRTVAATDRGLAAALALIASLLMFSPAQDEVWLWGLPSLQWHLCNLSAAAAVWLTARRPRPTLWLAACFVLTCAGMLAVASGIVLWGVALVVIVTEGVVAHQRPRSRLLIAWGAGALALLVVYFAGFQPSATAPEPSYFLGHPLMFAAFVLVYLGNPIVQGTNMWWIGIVGLSGLVGFVGAFYAVVIRGLFTEQVLPWLWLSSYALMVALATAVGRTQTGTLTATTNRYTTGALFFWIGLLVIAAVMLRRLMDGPRTPMGSALRLVVIAAMIVATLNYARLYRHGYRRFVATHYDRQIALAELSAYETAPDEALTFLYPPGAEAVRSYARILEGRGLGPFSPRMLRGRRQLDEVIRAAGHVDAGDGALDVAQCTIISGWAWDRQQPDVPVKVDIFGGKDRLATLTAYWYRRDLAQVGMGKGRHVYLYTPPARLKDGRARLIRARIAGTDRDLPGSPKTFVCSDPQAILWR